MVKTAQEELVVEVIDEELDMLDQVDGDSDEPAKPAQKRVRPGGSVKKVKSRLKEQREEQKVLKKKVTKKTAAAVAAPVKKKGPKAEKGDSGVPINAIATLKFLTKHPGSERTAIREKTGIENLGLPWLVAEGHVKETVVEGQRARQFTITKKGTAFLQKK